MRISTKSVRSAKVLWTTLLACCLQMTLIDFVKTEETVNTKIEDDSFQIDNEMPKRDWSKSMGMWGKRGWPDLHGGFAVKRSIPSWLDQQVYASVPITEKRSWKNLQGGWGKRMVPTGNEEPTLQEIATMLEREDSNNIPMETADYFNLKEEDKRSWHELNDGWGKRSQWDNFRGSWGKRSPAWNNLKGVWGKRSGRN